MYNQTHKKVKKKFFLLSVKNHTQKMKLDK